MQVEILLVKYENCMCYGGRVQGPIVNLISIITQNVVMCVFHFAFVELTSHSLYFITPKIIKLKALIARLSGSRAYKCMRCTVQVAGA